MSAAAESLVQDESYFSEAVVEDFEKGDGWILALGDNIEVMPQMKPRCVDLTVTSIPFEALFSYTASDRDFGNCKDSAEFFEHFDFWSRELLRVTKPGRVAAIHCMIMPSSKVRHGVIGLRDFRGDVVRSMQKAGWIFHSETAIWKDPVTAMTRTKALGLLWKQLRKDSTMSRTGILDYLCAFRAPGKNEAPVTHTPESYPVAKWQQVASPVWMDIDQGDTLNVRSSREHDDERHLCALQRDVIERCVELWSNPGDVVFDPFSGISSTGYFALKMGRRSIGIELKESYMRQGARNLRGAKSQHSLFDLASFDFPPPDQTASTPDEILHPETIPAPPLDASRVAELEEQLADLRRAYDSQGPRIAELEAEVASLGKQLDAEQENVAAATASKEDAESSLEAEKDRYTELERDFHERDDAVEEAEKERDEAREDLSEARESTAARFHDYLVAKRYIAPGSADDGPFRVATAGHRADVYRFVDEALP